MPHVSSIEYINDYLYFILSPYLREARAFIYCSGVNFSRFLPLTKGRHRAMANPVIRGLQLVNLEIRSLAISAGARPKAISGDHCSGIVPRGDGWYREVLLIESATESLLEEIIRYAPVHLLKKIDRAMILGEGMPDTLLPSDELQAFIESLCRKYGG